MLLKIPRQFSPLNTSIWDSTFIHDGLSVGVLGVSCRATVEHRMTEEEPFRVTNVYKHSDDPENSFT